VRYHALLPAALALSTLWLAACGNDTPTEPPEMALAGSWITMANMPASRTDLAAATVTNAAGQSIVYAIGGFNSWQLSLSKVTAYNVATNTWTFRRPLPTGLGYTNGAGVVNGKIYVSGGNISWNSTSRALYMYDPATNTWTRKRDMPNVPSVYGDNLSAGVGGVTGVINGKLYVVTSCIVGLPGEGYFEGCSEHPAPLFFRYNPVTDRWATLAPPLPAAQSPYAGGVIGGKFYVMTGWAEDSRLSVYDPATNQWTPKNALGLGRPGAATAVLGGKLYVIGGRRYNAALDIYETLDKTIVYDPATDRWTPVASLPIPRTGLAAISVLLNGKPRIELVGGTVPGNNLQYIP
jgi:N-acetylneuraminic acid mutarotase